MGHHASPVSGAIPSAFDLHDPADPCGPVVISVPHAGRDYDDALLAQARFGRNILQRLEDRFADHIAQPLIERGHPVLVARTPRAAIDLNRHEREIDAGMVTGVPRDAALHSSAKLRGGLGLIPRRMPGAHDLWRRPLEWAEVQRRIDHVHRPYHATLARLMRRARDQFGHAILIDLHSMPPLPPMIAGRPAPNIILGDRFGKSASARLMTLAADVADAHGYSVAQNHPYAGDHMLDRHGHSAHGLYAIQLECDRSLYLDAALDQPGPGLGRLQAMVSAMANALAHELPRSSYALAAE